MIPHHVEVTVIENGYIGKFGDTHVEYFNSESELFDALEAYKERIKPKDKEKPRVLIKKDSGVPSNYESPF